MLIIIILIVFGIAGLFFMRWFSEEGRFLSIITDNHQYQYSLIQNREVVLEGPLGDTVLTIKDRHVWIKEAPCPHQICRGMGKISRTGQTLVCIPNKIFIVIEGQNAPDIDAVSQ